MELRPKEGSIVQLRTYLSKIILKKSLKYDPPPLLISRQK